MIDQDRRPVAVVTGGGGGIGTAVALELARRGVAVVAMDPGVGLQGEPLNEPTAAQTARRITAEGGVARASTASVTDRAAVRSLFAEVVGAFGSLDIVVNTAGILRFAPFLDAGEDDWRAVLDVHLNGYLNVLSEALPVMVAAGYGRIVGVTSGAGLARAAGDSAAYACAKRAVAAVTWQLAGLLPDGIALNALSPLAATRMTAGAVTGGSVTAGAVTGGFVTGGAVTGGAVTGGSATGGAATGGAATAGAATAGAATGGAATAGAATAGAATGGDAGRRPSGGLDLSGLPPAQDMAPLAAYLASAEAGSCRGQVIFSAGPELSVISPPRLLEAVRTERTADFAASLDTLVPVVLGPAEAGQRSTGGSNARFGPVFDQPGTPGPAPGSAGHGGTSPKAPLAPPGPAGRGGTSPKAPLAPPGLAPASRNCLVISDNTALASSIAAALARCGLTAIDLAGRPLTAQSPPGRSAPGRSGPGRPARLPAGFEAAEAAVRRAADAAGGIDAVVIAPRSLAAPGPAADSWPQMLAGYSATVDQVLSHAGWLQAAARHAVRTSRPVRVVHLADAASPPLRAAAQAVAQLARCASLVRPGLIDVFSIALETAEPADHLPVAHLIARMLWSGDAGGLRGAELVARPGWVGIRSHPGPAATASYGTPAIPPWITDWLRESVLPAPRPRYPARRPRCPARRPCHRARRPRYPARRPRTGPPPALPIPGPPAYRQAQNRIVIKL